MTGHQTLIVLDFGSQVTQLIARRVRELGVYAEILPYHTPAAQLRARDPQAIILSGGPSSLYDEGAPELDPAVLETTELELQRLAPDRRMRGVEGVAEMPLRRVGQRVEAELNRLVQAGQATRQGGDWTLAPRTLDGFGAARPYLQHG